MVLLPPDASKSLLPALVTLLVTLAPSAVAQVPLEWQANPVPQGVSRLTPYFSAGKAAQAKAHFNAGNYAAAAKLFKAAGDSVPFRYLAALSDLRSGKYLAAAQ